MRASSTWALVAPIVLIALSASPATQGGPAGTPATEAAPKLAAFKTEAATSIDGMYDLAQQMVDSVFSFSEIGFQEFETQRYLTAILEREGFTVQRGVAGIPTAWTARFGSGKPVIALGSDIDGIPQASQKPGVAYRAPLIDGAPGHGEGHNSGVPLNIVAAIAVKRIMQREKLSGHAGFVAGRRRGTTRDEGVLRARRRVQGRRRRSLQPCRHQSLDRLGGQRRQRPGVGGIYLPGRIGSQWKRPWRGRSAMDAVELMNVGWNFRREHLRIQQRSHYVVTNGGDQPNVVPRTASVWYYFRETSYPEIKRMWEIGDKIAQGAAMMTDTTVAMRVLGSAWPIHTNKALAEAMHANIKSVGLPQWTEADVTLAKAVQRELQVPETGLATEIPAAPRPRGDT